MLRTRFSRPRRWWPVTALVTLGAFGGLTTGLVAQTSDTAAHGQMSGQDQQTARQLQELRAEVERLKAELKEQSGASTQPDSPSAQPSGGGMGQPMKGMDKDKMGMDKMEMGAMGGGEMGGMPTGMMDMDEGEMGMPPEGMEMPPGMMMDDMDDMDEMGMGGKSSGSGMAPGKMSGAPAPSRKPAAGAGTPKSMSSLPGMPGGSHLYHVGSTGFFLDQPQIALTAEQLSALNRTKERALLERGNADRRIEQAEQELWVLTGAERPDAAKIEAKARDIERLRTSQRLAFIQAVGEATKVLTPEQRSRLLGTGGTSTK